MTEDEMFGWHHQLDGHECEQALGVGDGQGSLVLPVCSSDSVMVNEIAVTFITGYGFFVLLS